MPPEPTTAPQTDPRIEAAARAMAKADGYRWTNEPDDEGPLANVMFWRNLAECALAAVAGVREETPDRAQIEAAAQAFQDAWNDFVADTGCWPDFIVRDGNGIALDVAQAHFYPMMERALVAVGGIPTSPAKRAAPSDVEWFTRRVAEWKERSILGHGLHARYQDAHDLLSEAIVLLGVEVEPND